MNENTKRIEVDGRVFLIKKMSAKSSLKLAKTILAKSLPAFSVFFEETKTKKVEMVKENELFLAIQNCLDSLEDKDLDKVIDTSLQHCSEILPAGVAVVSLIGATSVGVAKFLNHISNAEKEIADYAEEIGESREEAYRLKAALDAMGVSMEDIEASEELQEQFKILQEDAQKIQIPDMSVGVEQVNSMKVEFLRLKQQSMLALTWIGHYTMKYLQQPLEKTKQLFGGLNDVILKNIPKWSKGIGFFLSSIVRLGLTVIRGAKAIFDAIKKIFDMIPKEIKVVTTALAALALFIRAGPIGKLMFIITAALLLLEDFFVYVDGGEALLGGLWQKLIDIYNTLKESGAIEKFKQCFIDAMESIRQWILNAKNTVKDLLKQFQNSSSIEKIKKLFVNLKEILFLVLDTLKNIGRTFLDSFGGKGKTFLEWIVSVGLPLLLDLLNGAVSAVKIILQWLNKMSDSESIIKSIGIAFLGWKIGKGIKNGIQSLGDKITNLKEKWQDFKNKFANSDSFFGRIMQAIATTVENFISIIIDFFHMLWENIKLIFSAVKSLIQGDFDGAYQAVVTIWNNIVAFFKNIISKVVSVIKQVFSPIVNWFQSKVNDIKNKFSSIPQYIQQKFSEAVNNIKNVFQPIVDWFETKVAKIKSSFNGIGDKLNGVKNFVFGGNSENGYAEGGLVTQHQIAEIAEGNQPELIVPLTKKDRAKQLLQKGADYLGLSRFQPEQLQKAKGMIEQAAGNMAKLQTGLTATTYQTTNQTVSNQYYIDMTSKYTIHDTSGKPESTARAVDRTVQKRIRNLQGVL